MQTVWMKMERTVDLVQAGRRLTAGGATLLLDSCGRGRHTVLVWSQSG
ncbi:hypothetical protein [Kroppenstedtia guangzhouensis]|nr:hypothetical protein [Kroppenstedtia guangzhouensis]